MKDPLRQAVEEIKKSRPQVLSMEEFQWVASRAIKLPTMAERIQAALRLCDEVRAMRRERKVVDLDLYRQMKESS